MWLGKWQVSSARFLLLAGVTWQIWTGVCLAQEKRDGAAGLPSEGGRAVVIKRAQEHMKIGYSLAERRAIYAARAEFTRVLRLLASETDAENGTGASSRALEEGLRGLEQTDPFAQGNPIDAVREHLRRVQESLVLGAGREPVASMALCALARAEIAEAEVAGASSRTAGPKAVVLYRAALEVDRSNALAANELGVLFARYGRWEEAEEVLKQGVASSPRPELWHNLSVVSEKMGKSDVAAQAESQCRAMKAAAQPGGVSGGTVQATNLVTLANWVEPAEFIRRSAANSEVDVPGVEKGASAGQRAATAEASDVKPGFSLLPAWISKGLKK